MTTIAFKDGLIAYDSRVSHDDGTIIDDNFEKCLEANDVYFFMSGSTADFEVFIETYLTGKNPGKDLDIEAVVLDEGKLFRSSIYEKDFSLWRCPLRLDGVHAIGSGRKFALAYMDVGMTAESALINTAKRDAWTGGIIRTFNIHDRQTALFYPRS